MNYFDLSLNRMTKTALDVTLLLLLSYNNMKREGVKGHSPDRLEAYSSSAVFRLFLWMWLVCECVFGEAAL